MVDSFTHRHKYYIILLYNIIKKMPIISSSSSSFPALTTSSNMKRTPIEYNALRANLINAVKYNISVMLEFAKCRDSLGQIPSGVKDDIVTIKTETMTLLTTFATDANLVNVSADNQLGFYLPHYTAIANNSGLLTAGYIQVGSDIDLSNFNGMTNANTDAEFLSIPSAVMEAIANFQC